MVHLNNSLTQLPPLFLHAEPTDAVLTPEGDCGHRHGLSGSTLTCGTSYLRAKQRDVIIQSREGARRLTGSRPRPGGMSVGSSGWDSGRYIIRLYVTIYQTWSVYTHHYYHVIYYYYQYTYSLLLRQHTIVYSHYITITILYIIIILISLFH